MLCRRKAGHDGECAWAPFTAWRFKRLVVTICRQAASAPFIDDAWTTDVDGRRYKSKCILLQPRKSPSRLPRALVIGWRAKPRVEVRFAVDSSRAVAALQRAERAVRDLRR